jgi:hypothetical protein
VEPLVLAPACVLVLGTKSRCLLGPASADNPLPVTQRVVPGAALMAPRTTCEERSSACRGQARPRRPPRRHVAPSSDGVRSPAGGSSYSSLESGLGATIQRVHGRYRPARPCARVCSIARARLKSRRRLGAIVRSNPGPHSGWAARGARATVCARLLRILLASRSTRRSSCPSEAELLARQEPLGAFAGTAGLDVG